MSWESFRTAMTPAAGPDSMICTGRPTTEGASRSPPLDCMIIKGAETPASRRPSPSAVT